MKTSDFDYHLPEALIAQHPAPNRDESRMLVLSRTSRTWEDKYFYDIESYLRPDDVLVLNRTRVIPARLFGVREDTGGTMEFLLLRRLDDGRWETLVKPGRRAAVGARFAFGQGLNAVVVDKTPEGGRIVEFSFEGIFEEVLERIGRMPLPPYITEPLDDAERYQTVYAKERGSAAAPTAGLHFTETLLERIRARLDVAEILLHVGLGTFRPVKAEDVEAHHMHSEYYEVTEDAARRINAARTRGGRVVAVGTTSCRTLETCADKSGMVSAGSGWTDIFITPGYEFRAVDALITNFHLPQSTLLMLVSAFAGRGLILDAYKYAIERQYRFFSFGDCMLIV